MLFADATAYYTTPTNIHQINDQDEETQLPHTLIRIVPTGILLTLTIPYGCTHTGPSWTCQPLPPLSPDPTDP